MEWVLAGRDGVVPWTWLDILAECGEDIPAKLYLTVPA